MPLPKAPTAKGSVLIDIPAELPTQAPARKQPEHLAKPKQQRLNLLQQRLRVQTPK